MTVPLTLRTAVTIPLMTHPVGVTIDRHMVVDIVIGVGAATTMVETMMDDLVVKNFAGEETCEVILVEVGVEMTVIATATATG